MPPTNTKRERVVTVQFKSIEPREVIAELRAALSRPKLWQGGVRVAVQKRSIKERA